MTAAERDEGIGSWIHRHRVRWAGKLAVVSESGDLTYDELAGRIDRLADALGRRGVRRGDRVAYLGENHTAFLETLFAATSLGAIFVPLNTRLAPPELTYALNDSGARILIHDAPLATAAQAAVAGTGVTRTLVVSPAETSADDAPGAERYEAVLRSGAAEHVGRAVGESEPALILYTSGTTGHPKGAVITHGNLHWNCFNVLVSYDVTSQDVALMISPLFHVAALAMGVLPALLKGATVILEKRFEPGRTLRQIEAHRVTSLSGVPTTFQMLCEHADWAATDVSSLRSLTCGGSPVPLRVIDAFAARGLSFSGGYGMTETSPGVSSIPAHWSREKATTAGLPMHFVDTRVVDEHGSPAERHTTGEIQVRGRNVIPRYWGRPSETEASFTADGWLKTGDIGFFDDDGFLSITDRLKDMIISGGENVYPAEIEQAILEIPSIASASVIGVADPTWGEVPHAYVQLVPGEIFDRESMVAHLLSRLARYKVPKRFSVVEEFPRTASGKIRKADLRASANGT
ncbi:MAG TPA: long-chain fatty acid--CoA ligase [Microbacterium sp.]|nr:long-chain fatty acid--CoA ligase [Microbacterium sp.]